MSNLIIEKLLAKTLRTDLPNFAPGDSVRVHVKIKEGDKERLQAFEGVVIAKNRGPQASFTVRKISFGHGVERIFPIASKVVDKVDVVKPSKVRRAKLYYLRGLRGKAARLKDVEREAVAAPEPVTTLYLLEICSRAEGPCSRPIKLRLRGCPRIAALSTSATGI